MPAPAPSPASPPARNPLAAALRFLSSLQLTVILLAAAMVLVFLATIDQIHLGIHDVVRIYFRSFLSYYDLRRGGGWDEAAGVLVPPTPFFRIWLPGGYTLGTLLLVNLIAAHWVRFRWSWWKSGILLTHFGIILILVGELFTGIYARETQMRLDEGQTGNYSEDPREVELALVDVTDPGREKHFTVPESRLHDGARITHPALPFRIEVVEFVPNARLRPASEPAEGWGPVPADQGIGPAALWAKLPRARTLEESDLPAALVRLHEGGRSLGTWVVGREIAQAQRVASADGRQWDLSLRGRREYKPFSITLRDFQHVRYPGTNIPKDFSSFVTLTEPGLEAGRDVRIWMNHPLRHGGYAFYQSSFANNDTTSILQVVRNPSWVVPYISCVVVFVGLTIQFTLGLVRQFARKPPPPPAA